MQLQDNKLQCNWIIDIIKISLLRDEQQETTVVYHEREEGSLDKA